MAKQQFRSFLHDSTFKTEVLAGITTFSTMVYIIFINPAILHKAGMDAGAVFTATCLITAFACAFTGWYAKTPFGVAPGMALNIYFTYSVVQGLKIDWQHALGMVFISGAMFIAVTLTPLRRLLTESIPYNLQIAILIGISLLIALISLQTNGLIVIEEHTLHLGKLNDPQHLLFLLGFVIILILDSYQVKGAILYGILSITVFSLLLGHTQWHGIVSRPPSMSTTFLQLQFSGLWSVLGLKTIFTFFLITVFDATGTIIGLLNEPLLKKEPHYGLRFNRSLITDATASALAGLLGTASTSPYIESATGIAVGGKTGVTAIVVAVGFLLMLFFFPLAEAIPNFAIGPALLYVACSMMKQVKDLQLDTMTEAAPSMLTIMLIPFTESIADGIGAGIILCTLLKILVHKKIEPLLLMLAGVFVVFFLIS
ncbi:MAG: NCS2 family permease [Gammaproteobacteria bacterium]|nr:NCS2 family permease [Gammaproteobacteria bacterium]